jgi:hypothetical protein
MSTHRIQIALPTGSGRRTGWIKLVDSVDTAKANGYAFAGRFLRDGWEDLPEGGVLVEQYPTGSAKNAGKGGVAHRVVGGELVKLASVGDWFSPEFFQFRDAVASAIKAGSQDDPRADAIAQIRALMAQHAISASDLEG